MNSRSPMTVGSAVAMVAALAVVGAGVAYVTLVRDATAPTGVDILGRVGAPPAAPTRPAAGREERQSEERQLLEKAARDARQRQGEAALERRSRELPAGQPR